MKKEKMFAVVFLILVGLAWGEPVVKDGSLIGWWRFDGVSETEWGADSSGYGGTIKDLSTVTPSATGGYVGGKVRCEQVRIC